jgi:RNA polymerase sigma-70 factor, ECF subfamily
MAGERVGNSLQATALVNEAYLRLVDAQRVQWQDRAHFLAMSARLMRRVLVDLARAKGYQKRGGGALKVTFDEQLPVADAHADQVVAVDEALKALATFDERKSKVVELRFFGGLSIEETAIALKVSPETVMRDWKVAKSWLMRELRSGVVSHDT